MTGRHRRCDAGASQEEHMANSKELSAQRPTGAGVSDEDLSRRRAVMNLLGVAVGGLALEACAARTEDAEPTGSTAEEIGADVATYAALRALAAPAAGTTRFVLGRTAAGDEGRGLFTFYVYAAAPPADNDGTILKPGGGYVGNGRWRRVASGPLDVKWFGAVGDGIVDDAAAIQAAIDAALALQKYPGATGTGVYAQPTVYLPVGVYKVLTTVELPPFIALVGDPQATLTSSSQSVDLLRIGWQYNHIEGILFAGGRRAIALCGPSAHYGGNIGGLSATNPGAYIRRCTFRYQYGPSIAVDASTEHRGGSQNIEVTECEFQGCTFWYGTCDGANFSRCRIYADSVTRPVTYGDGRKMSCFVSSGVLNLSELTGAPADADAAWIEGTGVIRTQRVRFGGEAARVPWRVRNSNMSYLGEPLPQDTAVLAAIYSDEDAIASTAGNAVVEVYDNFPAVLSIWNPVPFGHGTPRSYGLFANPDVRVWVDSVSCPTSSFAGSSRHSLELDFRGFVAVFRVFTSTSPATAGVDITNLLTSFWRDGSSGVETGDDVQVNLWPSSGALGPLAVDPSYGWGTVANGLTMGSDSSLGTAIRNWTSNTATDTANLACRCAVNGTTGWGAGIPAGVYTLSVLVKANWSGLLTFGRDDNVGAFGAARFAGSGKWQRLWACFYHDGVQKYPALAVYAIPGTSGIPGTIALAFPAIHQGPRPSPYLYPGNSSQADYVPALYYGTSGTGPATGTYRVGDRYIVTNAAAGGACELQCVTAGSPGTWKVKATLAP